MDYSLSLGMINEYSRQLCLNPYDDSSAMWPVHCTVCWQLTGLYWFVQVGVQLYWYEVHCTLLYTSAKLPIQLYTAQLSFNS